MTITHRLSKYVYVSSPAPAPTEEDFVWEDPSSDGRTGRSDKHISHQIRAAPDI